MYDLNALGYGPFFENQLASWGNQAIVPARIAAEHRGQYDVWFRAGAGLARLSGKLRHLHDPPTVGDWVGLNGLPIPGKAATIVRVFERKTVFTRAAAGRRTQAQAVAANVDQVFVVCGLDEDFSLHRIERYLARIWASGAAPSVVLNKADVCPEVAERLREVERVSLGVPVFVTSALASESLAAIVATIAVGSTTAFVGSSGTGKSTLINAITGEATMATGETRGSDGQGRHTTTHKQLVLLPQGGLLLDTPGMRELQIPGEEGLDRVFNDIEELASQCRFSDCRHANEPGCAVMEAARTGALAPDRLEHYRQLQREAQAHERRHDQQLRRQTARDWGQRHEEAKQLRKWKEGF